MKETKESWIREQCQEVENYGNKHDKLSIYKKLRQITGTQRKRRIGVLRLL